VFATLFLGIHLYFGYKQYMTFLYIIHTHAPKGCFNLEEVQQEMKVVIYFIGNRQLLRSHTLVCVCIHVYMCVWGCGCVCVCVCVCEGERGCACMCVPMYIIPCTSFFFNGKGDILCVYFVCVQLFHVRHIFSTKHVM